MFVDIICSIFAVVVGSLARLLAQTLAAKWGLVGAAATV